MVVVVVVVVVGAIVVVVVLVDVEVDVDAIVGGAVGAASAPSRESCHCDRTYDTAPPAINAVTTRRTIPTLRFERPP
jgi:hypothetical protein